MGDRRIKKGSPASGGAFLRSPFAAAALALLLAALAGTIGACHRGPGEGGRPNVVWILWDTVRADRLHLYGHTRPTTPYLERFARDARVFDNCLSPAGTTIPAHASMFCNLLPHQFAADNTHCYLATEYETLPEIFQQSGYRTFLYSENPLISRETGFGQGFEEVAHPWSAAYRERAVRILEEKIPPDVRPPGLAARLRESQTPLWALSACGALGETALVDWLDRSDRRRPFFVFLNYMEAHAPIITPRSYRERLMGPEAVARSYALDVTPAAIWPYTFGLRDYGAADLAVIGQTYDASLLELDDLLRSLLATLKERGWLDHTVVVVTSDHGEYLGEHHLLDHQYFLYRQVLEVPLVLYAPGRVAPGHDARPVMNMDLFPTLLELAGIAAPQPVKSFSVSLLRPLSERARVAASRTQPEWQMAEARKVDPSFDPAPYRRGLLVLRTEPYTFFAATDGRQELYDLGRDPAESRNLIAQEPPLADRLATELARIVTDYPPPRLATGGEAKLTPEQTDVLRSLGYLGGAD